MLAELTMCWAIEFDPKKEVKKDIEAVFADRFEKSEREPKRDEEYERAFKLLLDEVQRRN